jgi:phosphoribosylformimino-5-aminoimidazole carboxamide ribotide isomerase
VTGSNRSFRAVPAVDLKGGRCVQLVGGRPEEERVSLPDPLEVAAGWVEKGFRTLHVVDLDAALGTGDHRDLIRTLARELTVDLQVGGGIRDAARAGELLESGARRIIVGTRAVEDRSWLEGLAARWPHRVVVAADIRDGVVLRKGWTESAGVQVGEFLEDLGALPLAGVLCTDVGREGQLQGMDREGVQEVLGHTSHPVWISGGVTTMDDLRFLDEAGAVGAVLGMALYTGALDANQVAEEFGG